jgi:uncharacterized iron-regulated membrane protein
VWRIGVHRPGETSLLAIEVNDQGAVRLPPEPMPGDGVPLLMRRIHDGVGLGIVWQSIIFIGGLAPALLAVTGTIMWLRRRARRRALKGKAEPTTLAAPAAAE